MEYIKANLRGNAFLLPLPSVVAVLSDIRVATVPFAPQGVCGIVLYCGNAVPVLDIFGVSSQAAQLQLVLQKKDHMVAYTADCVEELLHLTEEEQEQILEQSAAAEDEAEPIRL